MLKDDVDEEQAEAERDEMGPVETGPAEMRKHRWQEMKSQAAYDADDVLDVNLAKDKKMLRATSVAKKARGLCISLEELIAASQDTVRRRLVVVPG